MKTSDFTVFLICAYGVVKEFRPSAPFLTPFLESAPKNFTNTQLYADIYPFWTYAYMAFLIPVFALTDRLRYKPVVIFEALTLTSTWVLLVFTTSLTAMRVMQVLYGMATSARIAYFSYVYAVVDRKHFARVTSYIRSAALVGKFLAYTFAQMLITSGFGSYMLLNQISLTSVVLSLLIALSLPNVAEKALSADTEPALSADTDATNDVDSDASAKALQAESHAQTLLKVFRSRSVLVWSLWWAIASCGTFQVANYAQTLWAPMQNEGQFVGNGFVECVNTLSNTLLTFTLQFSRFNWKRHCHRVFFGSAVVSSLLLYGMARTHTVWLSYLFYVLNASLYQMLVTAASNTIAAQIDSAKFSLVFGFNTFVALALQSLLTLVVNWQLRLAIRAQFLVYSLYFLTVALIFGLCVSLSKLVRKSGEAHKLTDV